MARILYKERLAPTITKMVIDASTIAKKARAGQFVILRVREVGERIPLTICDANKERGTITIIFQEVGRTTRLLASLEKGDQILDLVGPLGRATEIDKFGKVVMVGGGVGTAVIYPITKALYQKGNHIITVTGARSKELLILEKELREVSHKVFIATDDGSAGHHGFVTEILQNILKEEAGIARVFICGPVPMMKKGVEITSTFCVKSIVSLNPIMVDGTGMCGSCRVKIGEDTRFACVDGPEFDGESVDFDLLIRRLGQYKEEERIA